MNRKVIDFCLLIPCYNNIDGLIESLQSVQYDMDLFHVLIVNDGSVEFLPDEQFVARLGKNFPFTVIHNNKNEGITVSLNRGLDWILTNTNTRYIARLDCGDTCHPDRFTLQVQYLDKHPQVGLLGTWCKFENKREAISYVYKTPVAHQQILQILPYKSAFIHPTVMFRAHILKKSGLYPIDFPHAEDYAFFWTLSLLTETYIIPQVLVTCEINRKGISIQNRAIQLSSRKKIISTFAKGLPRIAGLLKINLLILLPYRFVLQLKTRL